MCYSIADILFLIDRSASIEDPGAGGAAGNFARMTDYAAEVVRGLGLNVGLHRVRVAAMSFADTAKLHFDFDDLLQPRGANVTANAAGDARWEAHAVIRALRGIRYTPGQKAGAPTRQASYAGVFAAARELLLADDRPTQASGFRQHRYPLHVVVLTDGKQHDASAADLADLAAELQGTGRSVYGGGHDVTRWALTVRGGLPTGSRGVFEAMASSWVNIGVVGAESAADVASTVERRDTRCETTTPVTTPTTTLTTTPCSKIHADLVFVVDTSSASAGTSGSCPGTSKRVAAEAFVLDVVDAIAGHVSEDGVRIAAVSYGETARLEFDFASLRYDAGSIRQRLEHLPWAAGRAPTGPAAHTGLGIVADSLLDSGPAASASGFRRHAVPAVVVVVSDGSAAEPARGGGALASVLRRLGATGVQAVIGIDTGGRAETAELWAEAARQKDTQIYTLGCAGSGETEEALRSIRAHIELSDCLTTPTTTPTTSETTSTPTTTPQPTPVYVNKSFVRSQAFPLVIALAVALAVLAAACLFYHCGVRGARGSSESKQRMRTREAGAVPPAAGTKQGSAVASPPRMQRSLSQTWNDRARVTPTSPRDQTAGAGRQPAGWGRAHAALSPQRLGPPLRPRVGLLPPLRQAPRVTVPPPPYSPGMGTPSAGSVVAILNRPLDGVILEV